jgi:hypothetical protein
VETSHKENNNNKEVVRKDCIDQTKELFEISQGDHGSEIQTFHIANATFSLDESKIKAPMLSVSSLKMHYR